MNKIVLAPQPGTQTDFLKCPADICIYGGAAGGGKTYALLLDAVRCAATVKGFTATIFRRQANQLTMPGGLWMESNNIYKAAGGKPNNVNLTWSFPATNAFIKFSGMKMESDKDQWQGSQNGFIGFDELTHFTESQFWGLVSRLRSSSPYIRPYLRATCNPENNWVKELLSWWLKEDGYANRERSGKIRWLLRIDDRIIWFDSKKKCKEYTTKNDLNSNIKPISFSFIPANINDNQILIKNDPAYVSMLFSLPEKEKMRLLEGNWNIKADGKIFCVEDFKSFIIEPSNIDMLVITADTAMETKSANDFTVFQVWGRSGANIYLLDQIRGKFDFSTQLNVLISMIIDKKPNWLIIEKAATAPSLLQELRRKVPIKIIEINRRKDKYQRGMDAQGYVQGGYVYLNPKSDYYHSLIGELTNFAPENKNRAGIHDDQVDCLMDAIDYLLDKKLGMNANKEVSSIPTTSIPTIPSVTSENRHPMKYGIQSPISIGKQDKW